MQRLLVTGPRQVEFQEATTPECPADGVLVRARVTAVSTGTEIRVYRAKPVDAAGKFLHERVPFALPVENGYSMVGEVVEAGEQTEGFAAGDRVFVPASHKQWAGATVSQTTRIPENVSDEQAVFLNILGVAHIALRRGCPAPGENVAIVGAGVIGLSALAYCRAFGFRTVVVEPCAERLAVARKMGAGLALSPDTNNLAGRIADHFDGHGVGGHGVGGQGADLVLEAASNWRAVRTSMEIVRERGTVVAVSRHTETPDFNPLGHPFTGKQITLLTSYGYPAAGARWDRDRSMALTLQMLAEGKLSVEPMITHRVEWRELPEVYRQLDGGAPDMLGVVVDWMKGEEEKE